MVNMKELRVDLQGNADYFRNQLENIWRIKESLENSFDKMKVEQKVVKSRIMNNAEKQNRVLDNRTIEVTKSGDQA